MSLKLSTSHATLTEYVVVEGIAEVAYQDQYRQRYNRPLIERFREAQAAGSEALEAFYKQVSEVQISHDVHFDLEETNSEWSLQLTNHMRSTNS